MTLFFAVYVSSAIEVLLDNNFYSNLPIEMTCPKGLLSNHDTVLEGRWQQAGGFFCEIIQLKGMGHGCYWHRKTQEENQTAVKPQSSWSYSTHGGHNALPNLSSVLKGTGRSWSEAHRNQNAPSSSKCKRSCMERLLVPRQLSGKFSFHVVSFVWVDLPLMVCPVLPPNLSSVN